MPELTEQSAYQPVRRTLRPTGSDKTLAHLGDISASAPGTASATDAWTVMQRKMEAAGVIATGSGPPVFANQTALFYHDTAGDRLYVRGASDYTAVAIGATESEIIGHGATDPTSSPDATTPWIYVRTDRNTVFLKERSGSPGSYSYEWTGPLFEGSHRTEIVYHTADDPPALGVSWTWNTDTFNITSGGWTGNSGSAKWAIIVTLPRNSNNAITSPEIRIGDPALGDISFTARDGTGNIPSSVNNLQELVVWLDSTTLGGGGGGVQQVPADWDASTGVSRILNKPDVPPFQIEELTSPSGGLTSTSSQLMHTFPLDEELYTFAERYGEQLFLEGYAQYYTQADTSGVFGNITIRLQAVALNNAGVQLGSPISTGTITITESGNRETMNVRMSGVLPSGARSVRYDATVPSLNGNPVAGIGFYRLEVKPTLMADEVIVDPNDLGNNFTGDSTHAEELFSEIDEFPIQRTDFEDIPWPDPPGGIDDDGVEVRRTVTIHPLIQDAIGRGHHYIAKITYDAQFVGSATDGRTDVNFVHNIYTNLAGAAIETETINDQPNTVTRRTVEVDLPTTPQGGAPSELIIGFTVPTGQFDARLSVPVYEVALQEGIDASGFTTGGRIVNNAANNVQELAQQVYDYVPTAGGTTIDASGFDGNLSTTDDTLMEVAQAFDDYVPTALQTTVDFNQFSDPNNFIGGLRTPNVIGAVDNPANVRQAFVKADQLLQGAYDPFRDTQLLDRSVGGGFSSSFSVVNATPVYSNEVDIPQELRDLSVDVDVRVRVRVPTLDSAFRGDLRLIDPDNRTSVFYGAPEVVNGSVQSSGDFITFNRTIAAASVPDTFEVRFRRTDGGTGNTVFDQGFANMVDSTGGAGGMTGGQASSYSSTIIWLAGASIYDRLTTVSETTNHTLMSGHQFNGYDQIVFVFDGGAGQTQPIIPCWVDANLLQAAGANGILWIIGNWWLLISRQSPTTFRWRWRAPSNGLRRIIGISTN